MAAWVCGGCSTVYAVDAPVCPQCGGNQPRGDWEEPRDAIPATTPRTAPPPPPAPAAPVADGSRTE